MEAYSYNGEFWKLIEYTVYYTVCMPTAAAIIAWWLQVRDYVRMKYPPSALIQRPSLEWHGGRAIVFERYPAPTRSNLHEFNNRVLIKLQFGSIFQVRPLTRSCFTYHLANYLRSNRNTDARR